MFAFDDAAAMTSASRPESFAEYPMAVSASVTMSDADARSDPEAAARFMIPSMPFSMSDVFHPAIAIYSNASADSWAVKIVLLPISLAFSDSLSISFDVAPDIASTFDISDS